MPTKPALSADLERLRRLWGAVPDPDAGAASPPEPEAALPPDPGAASPPDPGVLVAALIGAIAEALGPDSKELAIARQLLEDEGDPEAEGPRTIGARIEAMFPSKGEAPSLEALEKMRIQIGKDLDDLEDVLEALNLGIEAQRTSGAAA